MDGIDRKILSIIQEQGRISVTELAATVGLSLSACHRRLRELEQSGAITGYRAVVAPESVGLAFEAIVFVTIARTDQPTITAFEEAVAALPNVVHAERLFGDPDYLLRVVAADLAGYQALYDSRLGALPGVQRVSSTLVMKRLVADRGLPLG
jgi:DNA-binding Lrp family transcriptional regulator